jgi:integrase
VYVADAPLLFEDVIVSTFPWVLRLVSHNPCTDVGRLTERRDRRQAKPLSYEEEARVKQFAPPWLATLITVLVETGMRVRKEALPLQWSDVSLETEPA